jgi:hypothetical protein
MPDAVQTPEPACSPAFVARWKRAVQRLPRKLRLPVLAGFVLLFGLVLYTTLSTSSATLNLVCRHNFRSAELSVFIDEKLIHTQQISGLAKKRFGLFDTRIEGSFSKSVAVPAGEHVVQVRLRSAEDAFDQTRQSEINLLPGKDATIVVSTQRGGMSLVYQGLPVAATNDTVFGYFTYLRTVLVTIFGSAISAAIGFVVQDFLRSRKTSCPVQNQNS